VKDLPSEVDDGTFFRRGKYINILIYFTNDFFPYLLTLSTRHTGKTIIFLKLGKLKLSED